MTTRIEISSMALAVAFGMLASCRDDSPTGPPPGGESSSTGHDPVTTLDSGDTPATTSAADGDTADSGGSVDTSSSSGPSGPACEDTCVSIPAEWNGPVAVMRTPIDDERPECPPAYPELVAGEHFGDLEALDLFCLCGCSADEVQCPTHVELITHGDDEDCESPGTGYSITTVCNSGPLGQLGYWQADFVEVEGGSCTASSEFIPTEAGFTTRWTLCGGSEPSEAECAADESCVPAPAPFEERLCVWSEGEHDCPSEGFSVRELVYEEFDDQRGCAECSCGDISGTCGGGLRLWGENTCPEGGIQDIVTTQVGECVYYDAQAAMLLDVLEPNDDVDCPSSQPVPTGEVVPVGAVTVCCSAE